MARINGLLNNFTGGEISPKVRRRSDLDGYYRSNEFQQNFISDIHGEMKFREGTEFKATGISGMTDSRLIPFVYDSEDSYIVEFCVHPLQDLCRFFRVDNSSGIDGDIINIDTVTILGVEKRTDEVVFHIDDGSGGASGNWVANRPVHVSNLTTTSYSQYNYESNLIKAVNVSAFAGANLEVVISKPGVVASGAVSANSTSTISAEYAIPNTALTSSTLLDNVQWVQTNDTMYFVSNGQIEIKELVRLTATTFVLRNFNNGTPATDAGTGPANLFVNAGGVSDYPRSIALFEGRLILGGMTEFDYDPLRIGATIIPAFDLFIASDVNDFTTFSYNAATLTDDGGYVFILDDNNDEICGLIGTKDFLYIQTIGGGHTARGVSGPLTYQSFDVKRIHNIGSRTNLPLFRVNDTIYFVDRTGLKLRTLDYNFNRDSYEPVDLSKSADHLSRAGLKRVAYSRGFSDRFYMATERSQGLVFSYDLQTGTNAWARYNPGDSREVPANRASSWSYITTSAANDLPTIKDVVVVPGREFNEDIVMFLVKRATNDWFIESRISETEWLSDEELYTGDIAYDEKIIEGDRWENQVYDVKLDASRTLTQLKSATLTFANSGVIGDTTATAGSATFSSGDVGKRILGRRSDRNVVGVSPFGIAEITAFNSSTSVDVTILEAFNTDSTGLIPASSWYLEANGFSILVYGFAPGKSIAVIADGTDLGDFIIPSSGILTFTERASVISFGYRYKGLVKSINLQGGSRIGPSDSHLKNISGATIKFRDTKNCRIGSDPYKAEKIIFPSDNDDMNRPTKLFNGEKEVHFAETWSTEKHIYIVKDDHGPCVVQAIAPYMNVSDD